MGGLILIFPIIAFDFWLALTTGRRQWAQWREQKNWRHLAMAVVAGLGLGVWLAFFLKYNSGGSLKVQGFPIPVAFYHLDKDIWTQTIPDAPIPVLGAIANFLTGLAAPIIPFKIAEFLKLVKAELK